jgi:hypothetical protein
MCTILRYRWQYVDEISGRQVKTRHHASAEDFLRVHPDAKPIPGTEHVLELPDNAGGVTLHPPRDYSSR